ncbi:MFS transporter [Paracoccus kondratievae]|uniref:Major facilitator superfamily transporter n=2 Tax=Paracoccus kondratievae TaxID=135740 RepID=A0A0G3BAC4_9RHOB|nr:MFS transporter [Paracoccus kondratievae]AKJ20474.1 major facilitator superfamily transporter [Paracoccus kondratievae]
MTMETLPDRPAASKTLGWRQILPVVVIVCVYAAGTAAVLPVLPFHIREMGGSPLILGIIIASEALGQFASAPLFGQLSDRLGRKSVLLLCQSIAALSLLLLALAPNLVIILIARAMFGFTVGNISVTAAYIADHSSPDNRRQAMGIMMGAAGLGGIIGAGLSGLLSEISLNAPILASFVLVLFALLVTSLTLENDRPAERETGERPSFKAILAAPAIRLVVMVMLFHFFAYGMYMSQMPVFLGDTFIWDGHAFTAKELSYLIMADGAVNIFAQLVLMGWLSKYLTERQLILVLFALLAIGFVTAGLASSIPVLLLAVFLISTGDALAKPTYMAALSNRVPTNRQGIVLGAAQSLVALADITSPVIGGFILGFALYGIWIGVAIATAMIGAVIVASRFPRPAAT